MYDAYQNYQETKKLEAYYLIKNRIVKECTCWVEEALAMLKSVYKKQWTEDALMDVFRWARN